jgi:hypothetical protein
MKPFDDHDDLTAKSVPEMIRTLWTLYNDMSADPTLASSACHIRSAVLALEDMRRVAFEVYLEGQQEALNKPAKKSRRSSRNTKQTERKRAQTEWLMNVRAASPWKN